MYNTESYVFRIYLKTVIPFDFRSLIHIISNSGMDNGGPQSSPKGKQSGPKPTYKMRPSNPSLLVPKVKVSPEETKEETGVQEVSLEETPLEIQAQTPTLAESLRGEVDLRWPTQMWDSRESPVYDNSLIEGAPFGTVEIKASDDRAKYMRPGLYPLYPNGSIDFGQYKRSEMLELNGTYSMRFQQDGPGTRRYWRRQWTLDAMGAQGGNPA
jgi:hypothetical protein